jgi:hypothetical protein
MFEHIQQYGLIDAGGIRYRPRAYGDPQPEGTWDGWLVFFPLGGGTAIAPPCPESTRSTVAALAVWAAGLTPVYLEGALARALRTAQQAPLGKGHYALYCGRRRLERALDGREHQMYLRRKPITQRLKAISPSLLLGGDSGFVLAPPIVPAV